MIHGPNAGVQTAWMQHLATHGVDGSDHGQVVGFLGQKVDGRQVEHNQMVATFNWLWNRYPSAGVH